MYEPAYSENNLNFGFVFVFLQKLDTVKEDILLELVLNIYICHLGRLEAKQKFVLQMIHSRIPDFKDLSMVTTVTDHWSNKICRHWDSF